MSTDSRTSFDVQENMKSHGGDGGDSKIKSHENLIPDTYGIVDTGDGVDGDFKLDEFPAEVFPKTIRRFIRETSGSLVVPPEMVGVPLLVMCASGIGNSRVIRAKGDWEEGATLYAATVALPGKKKTPAAKKATKPLYKEQSRLNKEYKDKRKNYEKELSRINKDGTGGEPPTEPALESTFMDDTTVEALMETLSLNPRGLMVSVDELGGWIRSMDQYKTGKGSDRQKYLSLWSNSPVKVDRKRQETIALDRPFVSIYGGIQPDILPEIAGGREDGMLDRFLLSYPDPLPSKWSDVEVSEAAKQAVTDLYEKLRGLHMDVDDYGDPNPRPVTFDADAKEVFVGLINEHNKESEQPGFPNKLRGPWSKLEAYALRLTLVISLMRSVTEGSPERVELRDVVAAEKLLGYFKSHTRKVYGVLYEPDVKDLFAVDVVRFLESMGGSFHEPSSVVLKVIKSEHKPDSAEQLTKWLKEIANRTTSVNLEQKDIGRGKDKCRGVRLSLRNTVPTVPGVHNGLGKGNQVYADGDTTVPTVPRLTQREAVEGWNKIMDDWGKRGVVERLVEGKVSKEDVLEKATRLVLYSLDCPTHDWERHADEVEGCMDRRYEEKTAHLTEDPPF